VPGGRPGVVTLSGDFDAGGHEEVRSAVATALAHGRPETVVDMRAVRLLDAGTVRVLLEAWQAAADTGRRLRVTGAGGHVRHVIQAAGAGQRLFPEPTDDRAWAAAQRQYVADERTRIIAALQQQTIDGEVRTTRRLLIARLRRRLRTDPGALSGEEFLAAADTPAVLDAILVAATVVGAADACDLQLYDQRTASLRITRQRGLADEFLANLAAVPADQPTTCATAASTGHPVLVDDITLSPIFAGRPTLDVMLAAGWLAVHSHPLHHDTGRLLGVLSFHYRTTTPHRGDRDLVARCAAEALTRMPRL
jgi:anti-anti-sigma factor